MTHDPTGPVITSYAEAPAKTIDVRGTQIAYRELGPRGIRVNTVSPGFKWGPVLEQALQEQAAARGVDVEAVIAPIRGALALGRIPTDADVADAVVFFCSDLSRSITGQTLYVDGGHGPIAH